MYCNNLWPEFIRDDSEASFLLTLTFIERLSCVGFSTYFFHLPLRKFTTTLRYMHCVFPLLWTPPAQLVLAVKFPYRCWDDHLNWNLMFTHHFPVGSDSLSLLSASLSSLLTDTSRLTYPQEANVFSCWSHSILITWQCSKVRLIYLFPCCLLG